MSYIFVQCYSWRSTQCLISPYLFLVCAEIMGIANRRSEDIRGLKLLNSDTAIGGLKLNYYYITNLVSNTLIWFIY